MLIHAYLNPIFHAQHKNWSYSLMWHSLFQVPKESGPLNWESTNTKIKWEETELVLDGNDGNAPYPTPHAITCYNVRPLTTTTSTRLWRPAVLVKTRVGSWGSQSRGLIKLAIGLGRSYWRIFCYIELVRARIAIYDIQPQKEGRRS